MFALGVVLIIIAMFGMGDAGDTSSHAGAILTLILAGILWIGILTVKNGPYGEMPMLIVRLIRRRLWYSVEPGEIASICLTLCITAVGVAFLYLSKDSTELAMFIMFFVGFVFMAIGCER